LKSTALPYELNLMETSEQKAWGHSFDSQTGRDSSQNGMQLEETATWPESQKEVAGRLASRFPASKPDDHVHRPLVTIVQHRKNLILILTQ
jgi:hypothetical protein